MKDITNYQPLAIHFLWHPDDHAAHCQDIMKFRQYLTRDIDRPFSRELNIPTFLYSSRSAKKLPNKLTKIAQKDLLFLFLSQNTLIDDNWNGYIKDISPDDFNIIPIALDKESLTHANSKILKNKNFIRAYEWPLNERQEYLILMLSHEVYRFGFHKINEQTKGKDISIKIFLSHAKQDVQGINLASEIRDFIDKTCFQRFFDTTDIAPCFSFDEEIQNNLKESSVIAIGSDKYSSRYWCQREILMAKEEGRPIIYVDTLEYYEDRIFPASVNIPNIHFSHDPSLKDKEVLRILIATLLETIRFNYAKELLTYYQNQGWINTEAIIFARPPEVDQVVKLLKERKEKGSSLETLHICYPEPAVYPEEIQWVNYFKKQLTCAKDKNIENEVQVVTPLWSIFGKKHEPQRIGISISDYKEDQFESHNQHIDELRRLSQVIASHLLSRKHTLIYGGDLRDDGFTQFILDEAMIIQNRLKDESVRVENHLAWPIYLDDKVKSFQAKYHGVLYTNYHIIPDNIVKNEKEYLKPNGPENKYIWSRCLTEMRAQSIKSSDVRIFAGGKCEGYLGKMPGLLEEFLIALELNKPIYLLGGFGGITQKIADSILNKRIEDQLTEDWQIQNNVEYFSLQKIASKTQHGADYKRIEKIIISKEVEQLVNNTGLNISEYQKLMKTPFIDEAVHLILKGLSNLK